jgi:hypothetical protein
MVLMVIFELSSIFFIDLFPWFLGLKAMKLVIIVFVVFLLLSLLLLFSLLLLS